MTYEQIKAAAEGLGPRDFARFARRIMDLDQAVGQTVALHAAAAEDGNSPDLLPSWVDAAVYDSELLAEEGITTKLEAARWWYRHYNDEEVDDALLETSVRVVNTEIRLQASDEYMGYI